jgi:hypothetical protein
MRFLFAVVLTSLAIVSAGCVAIGDLSMLAGARGEVVFPVGSEADGVGLGASYNFLEHPRTGSLWKGWNVAIRSIPREGDNIVSFGAGLDLQWMTDRPIHFVLQFGLSHGSAGSDAASGALVGAGMQTYVACGPFPLVISLSYMHTELFDETAVSFDEPRWISLQMMLVLSE